MVHIAIEIKRPVVDGNVAPIAPVGHVHVEVGEQGLGGGSQQGGEVPGESRHDQHPGLAVDPVLGKMDQTGKGGRVHDVLPDRHQLACRPRPEP